MKSCKFPTNDILSKCSNLILYIYRDKVSNIKIGKYYRGERKNLTRFSPDDSLSYELLLECYNEKIGKLYNGERDEDGELLTLYILIEKQKN